MKHPILADTPIELDFALWFRTTDIKVVSLRNSGSTTLYVFPGKVREPLPDTPGTTHAPVQGYTALPNEAQRALEFVEWNGIKLDPGDTLERSASADYSIAPLWTVISPADDGELTSTIEG